MMNDDIRAAIDKNLSAEVGERLKARLSLVDALEKEITQTRDSVKLLEKGVSTRDDLISNLREQLQKHTALDKREVEIREKENKLEVTLAKAETAAQKHLAESVYRLAETVFRGPVVVTERSINKQQILPASPGCYPGTMQTLDTTREVTSS